MEDKGRNWLVGEETVSMDGEERSVLCGVEPHLPMLVKA